MDFDINAAQQAGYSPSEIAAYMAQQTPGFDLDGARKAGYSDEEIMQHLGGIEPPATFDQNVNNDLTNRQNQASNIVSDYQSGKLNPAGAIAGTASTGLGLIKDVAGDVGKSVWNSLPDAVTEPVESGAKSVGNAFMKTPEGMALSIAAPLAKAGYSQFEKDHPNIAAGLNLAGNTAAVAPIAEGATSLANVGTKALTTMGEGSGTPDVFAKFMPKVASRAELDATASNLQINKNTAYDNGKALGGVLTAAASDHVGLTVPSQVESTLGIRLDSGDTYSQTRQALANLQRKTEMGLTTNDLEQTRQRLNDILNGSSSGGDRTAAVVAKKALDDVYAQIEQNPKMLVNGNPAAVQAFRDAREANGVYQRYSDVSNIIKDSRSNPTKIQSAFQKLVDSRHENDFNRYAPDEQQMIEKIAYPNGIDTKLPQTGIVGKAAKATGVAGAAFIGKEAGELIGMPTAGAIAGGAVGTVGALNNTLKGAKILKGADDVQKAIASKMKPISPVNPLSSRSAAFQQVLKNYRKGAP
jgi:hypothetical protein